MRLKEIDVINRVEKQGFLCMAPNTNKMTDEEFSLYRCEGFGASDSSILLGVNPFPNGDLTSLIIQKADKITLNEIGKKASVRMGKDLEKMIIKWANKLKIQKGSIYKPTSMFKHPGGLLVNFDGVFSDTFVPIEIKVVTKYGRRYYDFSKAFMRTSLGETKKYLILNDTKDIEDIREHCIVNAKEHGIPVYYYTQLQQQMLALGVSYGYLCVLDVEEWELAVFKVYHSTKVFEALLQKARESIAVVNLKRAMNDKYFGKERGE